MEIIGEREIMIDVLLLQEMSRAERLGAGRAKNRCRPGGHGPAGRGPRDRGPSHWQQPGRGPGWDTVAGARVPGAAGPAPHGPGGAGPPCGSGACRGGDPCLLAASLALAVSSSSLLSTRLVGGGPSDLECIT
jgi:hypothetical protein